MPGPILRPRLRAVADLVPAGSALADVGTDHGYIPVSLLLEGRVRRAVASDIGSEPLARAAETVKKYGAEGVALRLGDGLTCFAPGEADCVVIAGMGGDSIASILGAAPWTRENTLLLLQPMSKAETLRRWLPENGYAVTAEKLAADKGVIYPILTVRGGDMPPAGEAACWGGFLLKGDPLWGDYLADRILRLKKAAAGLERARDPAMREKRKTLLEVIQTLEAWKGEWLRADGI